MIFYTITDTLPVVPDWSIITGDLKAGTPISIKGAVANDEAAIGLVAGDTAHGAEYAVVVTAGVVDLNAASASYGSTVSDDVVQALDNVTFIYGGKVYAVTPSELPSVSSTDNGKVLTVANGAWSAQTPSGGDGVTTLYFDHDAIYETSNFSTDPTMSDPSATVTFAAAVAMVQANPASVVFQSNANGAMPAHALADPYGDYLYITMLTMPTSQSGMIVYGYLFSASGMENYCSTIYLAEQNSGGGDVIDIGEP